MFLLMVASSTAAGQTDRPPEREYEFKAVYLYHFLRFIEWPEQNETEFPLVIGVLGEDPFGSTLDEVLRGETINGRSVVASRYPQPEDVGKCHVLFVARKPGFTVERVLRAVQKGTVIVGETPGFAEGGGAINFYIDNSRLMFEINEEAFHRAGVKVSSQLLRLSKIVGEQETRRE
jgi:hypothetical protein